MEQNQQYTKDELAAQFTYMDAVSRELAGKGYKAYAHTFGCQQNEADTERLRGMLVEMGYEITEILDEADLVLYNTCAVREHAEQRALGHIGALRTLREKKPHLIVVLCGCMAQQESNVERVKKSFPQVNLMFGTHALWRFPSLLYRVLTEKRRVFDIGGAEAVPEGLPVLRQKGTRAWLSIMYGCNNHCTYCIVPFVRGKERSRQPEQIENELRELVAAGYKEITLLGQNVNSYGKDLQTEIDFAALLERLDRVAGEYWLRFMTSHPKDAGPRLFDTMAKCKHIAKQLHLPVQSGSDVVLRRMGRQYTAAQYKEKIAYARAKMPEITLTSDIIVGFPDETEQDFDKTLALVREIGYDQLFTFIYSKRGGTPAARLKDDTTAEAKQKRMERLLALQSEMAEKSQAAYQDKIVRVLIDGSAKSEAYPYTARTEGNLLVLVRGAGLSEGQFVDVRIEKATLRCLYAVAENKE